MVALAVVAAPAVAAVVAVAAEVGRVPVAGVALRGAGAGAADKVVVERAAKAAHAAAVDGVKAKAVIAKADAETVEASSSRT